MADGNLGAPARVGGIAAALTLADAQAARGGAQLINGQIYFTDKADWVPGGSLRVTGVLAHDILSILGQGDGAGQVGVTGSEVRYGGVVIGTVSGGNGTTLTVTFNANAGADAVAAVAGRIGYQLGEGGIPADHDLHFGFVDGAGRALANATQWERRVDANYPAFDFSHIVTPYLFVPVLGDLNGDGYADLILLGKTEDIIEWRIQDYDDPDYVAWEENVGSPIYGEILPDGRIMVRNGDLKKPASAVYLNDRNGGFTYLGDARTGLTTNFSSGSLADVDGDGDLDLFYVFNSPINYGDYGIGVIYNDGGGHFGYNSSFMGLTDGLLRILRGNTYISAGDIDQNGTVDILVQAGHNTVTFGTGGGNFAFYNSGWRNTYSNVAIDHNYAPTFAGRPYMFDYDSDGDLDVLMPDGNGVRFFENKGRGVLVETQGGDNPFAGLVSSSDRLAFGDLDGDGDLDVVVTAADNYTRVIWNNSSYGAKPNSHDGDVRIKYAFAEGGNEDVYTYIADFAGLGSTTPAKTVVSAANGVLANDRVAGTITAVLETNGRYGNVQLNPDGSFVYTPGTYAHVNSPTTRLHMQPDQFTYRISDGATLSAPILVNLTMAPSSPSVVPADDQGAVQADASTIVHAMENDHNPSGRSVAVSAINGVAVSGPYNTITLPSGATLEARSDGQFTYTPGSAFDYLHSVESGTRQVLPHTATDSFTYTVDGNTATVTLTITGVDGPGDAVRSRVGGIASSVTFDDAGEARGAPQLLNGQIYFTDKAYWAPGGTLSVTGVAAYDRLSILHQGNGAGQVGVDGATIRYGGVAVGTVSGGNGTALTVTFNAAATADAVTAVAGRLAYQLGTGTAADHSLQLTFTDGHGVEAANAGQYEAIVGKAYPVNPFAAVIGTGDLWYPAVGDFNGDGIADIALGGNAVRNGEWRLYTEPGVDPEFDAWLESLGSPIFRVVSEGVYEVQDGDQRSPSIRFFLGDGAGNFHQSGERVLSDYVRPVAVDVNGDGALDIVYSTRLFATQTISNSIGILLNDGSGGFSFYGVAGGVYGDGVNQAFDPNAWVAAGDHDGDGTLDIIWSIGGWTYDVTFGAMILQYMDRGAFDDRVGGTVGTQPFLLDYDADGDLDGILLHSAGRYFENVAGAWTERLGADNPFHGLLSAANEHSFADVDGDGDLDILVVSPGHGSSVIWNNSGYGAKPNSLDGSIKLTFDFPAEPAGADAAIALVYGASRVLSAADFGFSDPAGGTLAAIVFTTVPANGALTLDGVAVTAGQAIDAADIAAGKLVYAPGHAGTQTYAFQVRNQSGTLDPTPNSIGFTMAQNTAPTLTDVAPGVTFTKSGDPEPQLIAEDAEVTDAEGNFAGGKVIVSGLLAEDVVGIRNQGSEAGLIGLTGPVVRWGGVAIGTVNGGEGETLTITLNGNATVEAVQALVRNLTYSNSSGTPTASRDLNLKIVDAAGAVSGTGPAAFEGVSANQPYALPYSESIFNPAFIDLNNDGVLDLVIGDSGGSFFSYIRNQDGSLTELVGSANPFDGISVGSFGSPATIDLNGDGYLDMVLTGGFGSGFRLFFNDGNSDAATFTEATGADNVFGTLASGSQPDHAFVDADGDGDIDLVSNTLSGIRYYRNDDGVFSRQMGPADPFSALGLPTLRGITFVDLNGDGLQDLVGATQDDFVAARNNGDGSFTLLTSEQNPLYGLGTYANFPQSVDYDGDLDLDLVYGILWNTLGTIRNTTASGTSITVTVEEPTENSAPTSADRDVDLEYGVAYQFQLSDFPFTDADGNSLAAVVIISLPPLGGLLTLDGEAVTLGQVISAQDIADGKLSFQPDRAGTPSFGFQVQDDGGTENGGADTSATHDFTFTIENTKPTLTGVEPGFTFAEDLVNATPQLIAANAVFADAEGNFAGGTLVVTGLLGEDRVSLRNQGVGEGEIALDGTTIRYGGVEIGTLSGGSGDTLTITFTSRADSDAVQAVIRNLTYANTSDTPQATRTLNIMVTDFDGADFGITGQNFVPVANDQHPYQTYSSDNLFNAGFVDLNNDGVLDLVVGKGLGGIDSYIKNPNGTLSPLWFGANPFDGVNMGYFAAPAFGDVVGDGNADMIVAGAIDTGIRLFRNNGGGSFTELTGADNPFTGISAGYYPDLVLADVDGDGLNDLVIYRADTTGIDYYRNVDGTFVLQTGAANIFAGVELGQYANMTMMDLNDDGRLDVVGGTRQGLQAWINTGTGFVLQTGEDDPFAGLGITSTVAPQAVDFNGDGVLDLIFGATNGGLYALRNEVTRGVNVIVNVTQVNDAPSGADNTITIDEDNSYIFAQEDFGFTDPDGGSLYEVVISTLPASGTLTFEGVPVWQGQAIPWYDIQDGKLVYTPERNANGEAAAEFTFQVRDQGGVFSTPGVDTDPNPKTITFDINPVDDPLYFTTPPVSLTQLTEGANAATASVSADGGWMVFTGNGDLIDDGYAGSTDLYLMNVESGALTRLSDVAGIANLGAFNPVLSPDGTKVAFFSARTDLVAGDTNGVIDLFVLDLGTGAIVRANTATNGGQASGFSMYDEAVFSADGKLIAFSTSQNGLVSGDTNNTVDIFVKNLETGVTERVSVTENGSQLAQLSLFPFFSADGTKVGFVTSGAITADDDNEGSDIYVRDLLTGEITRVTAGVEAGDYRSPIFSPDGSKILFYSYANGIVENDQNNAFDLFLLDVQSGNITLVSSNRDGDASNGSSSLGMFSPDGTRVIFTSDATNLAPGEIVMPGTQGVFAKDLITGDVVRLSVNDRGNPTTDWWVPVAVVGNGSQLLFRSQNALLPGNASDGSTDFYLAAINSLPARYIDGRGPVTIAPGISITDPDGEGLDGAVMTVSLEDGDAADRLVIAAPARSGHGIELTEDEILFNGVAIGTYTLTDSKLTVSFNGDASFAAAEALAEAVQFTTHGAHPVEGTRFFIFELDAGEGGYSAFSRLVEVFDFNQAPTAQSAGATLYEGESHVFTLEEFGFADGDEDSLIEVMITTLPTSGTLMLDGVAVTAGQGIDPADILAGKLSFVAGMWGDLGFTYRLRDDGGNAHGSSNLSAPTRFDLEVINVNESPTGGIALGGAPVQGEVLTVRSTLADGDGMGTLQYQWMRDSGSGYVQVGAGESTYTLGADDVGAMLRVVVYYLDGGGTWESVSATMGRPVIADARTTQVSYDVFDDKPWTTITTKYDALGGMESQTFALDNGGVWINNYDTANISPILWASKRYDASNNFVQRVTAFDNGTFQLTLYDAKNEYGWFSMTISYDANWNQTGVTGLRDNFTAGVTQGEIDQVVDNILWFTTPYDPNFSSTPTDDTIVGGSGADILYGFGGNDTIYGMDGNDFIVGGRGDDILTGGTGSDTFSFRFGDGDDIITDFETGVDLIDLHGYGITSFADLLAKMAQDGDDVVITLDTGNSITLHDVQIVELSSGDFTWS